MFSSAEWLQATLLTVTDEKQGLIGQMPHLDSRLSFEVFFVSYLGTYPPLFHIYQSVFYSDNIYLTVI